MFIQDRPILADMIGMAPRSAASAVSKPWFNGRIPRSGLVLTLALVSISSHSPAFEAPTVSAATQPSSARLREVAARFVPDAKPVAKGSAALALNAMRAPDGLLETPGEFRFAGSLDNKSRARDCLASAALYEAGNDRSGQRAVAQVVLNRVRHRAYPATVCGVVFQGSERRTGCQFTFTCDGSLSRKYPDAMWDGAYAVADEALNGFVDDRVGTATHYHADYVLPYWASSLDKLATIDRHIFYRFRGEPGRARALGTYRNLPEAAMNSLVRPVAPAKAEGEVAEPAATELVPIGQAAKAGLQKPADTETKVSSSKFMLADSSVPNGRWAMQAISLCAGRESCVVLGYATQEGVSRNRRVGQSQREKPVFAFIQDARYGLPLVKWDCERSPRADASECLPQDRAAIANLIRDRG